MQSPAKILTFLCVVNAIVGDASLLHTPHHGSAIHAPHHNTPHHGVDHHAPHHNLPHHGVDHHTPVHHNTGHHAIPHATPHHTAPHHAAVVHHEDGHHGVAHHNIGHHASPHHSGASHHASPHHAVSGHHQDETYHNSPSQYGFDYAVHDEYSGNNYGHSETRDGYKVEGTYYVHLPDGRVQTVNYYADETGYHPTVTYEGTPSYHQEGHH